MDGILRNILSKTRSVALGKVENVYDIDGRYEVELTVIPTEEIITAEVAIPVAGSGGGVTRKPAKGDIAVVVYVDSDLSDAVVISWLHHGNSKPPQKITEGLHLVAPKGEDLEVRSDNARVLIESDGKVTVESKNGDIRIKANGEMSIENTAQAKLTLKKSGGITLGNATEELGALLFETLTLMNTLVTALSQGSPLPVVVPSLAPILTNLTTLSARVKTLSL